MKRIILISLLFSVKVAFCAGLVNPPLGPFPSLTSNQVWMIATNAASQGGGNTSINNPATNIAVSATFSSQFGGTLSTSYYLIGRAFDGTNFVDNIKTTNEIHVQTGLVTFPMALIQSNSVGTVLLRDGNVTASGSIIAQNGVFNMGDNSNPNGLVTAIQPAICYNNFGALWIKINLTYDNGGWLGMITNNNGM